MTHLEASLTLLFTCNLTALAQKKRPVDWVKPQFDTIDAHF